MNSAKPALAIAAAAHSASIALDPSYRTSDRWLIVDLADGGQLQVGPVSLHNIQWCFEYFSEHHGPAAADRLLISIKQNIAAFAAGNPSMPLPADVLDYAKFERAALAHDTAIAATDAILSREAA